MKKEIPVLLKAFSGSLYLYLKVIRLTGVFMQFRSRQEDRYSVHLGIYRSEIKVLNCLP